MSGRLEGPWTIPGLAAALALLALAGCYESAATDGGSDADGATDGDALDGGADADADADVDVAGDGAGPGETCGVAMDPPCAAGLMCVQTAPPYCGADYVGVCTARPIDCFAMLDATVCDCDGNAYRNECAARRVGVATLLRFCTAECLSDADCDGGACRRVPDEPGGFWSCNDPPRGPVTGPSTSPEMDRCTGAADCDAGCDCYLVLELYPGFLVPHNECLCTECTTDADCPDPAGSLCLPAGTWEVPRNRCIPVGCRVDDDCTDRAGGNCVGVRDPCSALDPPPFSGKFCRYPGDCVADDDCASGRCVADWGNPSGGFHCDMPVCPG